MHKNTGIELPTSNPDPLMDSFMEKFSQFLSINNNKSEIIDNSMSNSNFLQKANEFYSQRSINKSLSNSQTSKS